MKTTSEPLTFNFEGGFDAQVCALKENSEGLFLSTF